MKSKQILTLLAAAVIGALSANAALFVDTAAGPNPQNGTTVNPYNEGSFSIEFTVNTPVTVSALGVFDQGLDGFGSFAGTWQVGLWSRVGVSDAGTLLTSIVDIDGSDSLNGVWRMDSFAGVTLNPGVTYAITVQDSTGFGASLYNNNTDTNGPSDSLSDGSNLNAVYGSEFNVILTRFRGTGGQGFDYSGFTDIFASTGSTRTGAGAETLRVLTAEYTVVPEPETYALIAGAGLVGFGLWRRRASKA